MPGIKIVLFMLNDYISFQVYAAPIVKFGAARLLNSVPGKMALKTNIIGLRCFFGCLY